MNMAKSIFVAAGIVLALTFTVSCSGGGGKDDDGDITGGVSGSATETSCSSSIEASSPSISSSSTNSYNAGETIKKSKISGVFQKGPFVQGSLATLNELDSTLNPTGRPYQALITDDKGTFEIRNVELVSPYAHLIANGFYRNEVTGNKSNAQITLQAIVDVQKKDQVNVNILTHLEYYRVLNLVDQGKTVNEAKKQAQKEIFAVFGINSDSFKDSEDMTIFGTSESDAALLAISVLLLLGNLSDADFSQLLMDFSQAVRTDGVWNNEATKTAIADFAFDVNLLRIKNNILGWSLASAVPAFEKYVKNYWATNYGLGQCNAEKQGTILKNANANSRNRNAYYICRENFWELFKSFAPELYCNMHSSVFAGVAIEPVLGCNDGSAPFDIVFSGDLPNWSSPVTGTYVVNAQANCGLGALNVACGTLTACSAKDNTEEKYCSNGVMKEYGYVADESGQTYKTVEIGTQTWMAENMDYYGNYNGFGVFRGDWRWAMLIDDLDCNYRTCTSKIQPKHRGICPEGWHIPTDAEWNTLINYVGGPETAGKKLKSTSGWNIISWDNKGQQYSFEDNGTDNYGFSAQRPQHECFTDARNTGYTCDAWWSATESSSSYSSAANDAWSWYIGDKVVRKTVSKPSGNSVRCVKD